MTPLPHCAHELGKKADMLEGNWCSKSIEVKDKKIIRRKKTATLFGIYLFVFFI